MAVKKKNPRQPAPPRRNLIIAAIIVFTLLLAAATGYSTYRQEQQPESNAAAEKPNDKQADAGKADDKNTGNNKAAQSAGDLSKTKKDLVVIKTSLGDIEAEVYPELMPVTVTNFEKLAGSEFYNGLTFHRVEDWVVQGGDPEGDGSGGPGWTIKLETNPLLKNTRGAVAMARSEKPDTAGSQFYILKKDASWLDGDYAVFGRVVKGMEIVDRLKPGDKMQTVDIAKN
ncbi:peptidyl-prolyl cis-trans isomerase [Desulfocucumis palustris]|uniref:Peptidyl-prolyl cis-trans isomerase n=1 Tax=Desulfocucumis palustris TaxID=1898651 RepID=A0A2L2X7N6_9FIRM|nr:peptidylprolyl isomerase [Desulfocucumis palustris]GBF31992.1 peptidyl-prolyl cis-trans isomerase [Desulfocucumis palustris]